MEKLMAVLLVSMTMIILTLTITFAKREEIKSNENKLLLLLAVFALMWCGGYAGLGLSGSVEMAILMRRVALMGVHGYISVEAYFAFMQTKFFEKYQTLVLTILVVPGVIIAMLLSLPGVVEFIPTSIGYRYLTEMSTLRIVQVVYIGIMWAFSLVMAYIWWKAEPTKRVRRVIILIVISECLKIVGMIFDTYLPMMGYASIPGTAIAVFFSFVIMRQLTSVYSTFYISTGNLSKYIYQNVNATVVVFDAHGKVSVMNDYGKTFFHIHHTNKVGIEDLFELTKEDAEQLIQELTTEYSVHEKTECRLIASETKAICMANFTSIRDNFGDVFCVICFVNDITKSSRAMNELQELKDNLQKDLEAKTKEIEEVSLHSISTIARIVDTRDAYASGHSYRVAEYCELIAKSLGWDKERIENLKYIALLHNIGMLGVSDAILNKTQALTKEERVQIQMHTAIGRDILKDIKMVKGASSATYYHHERFDGTGYPEGLAGKDIPIASRIIAVADAYDAMGHDRIYRNKLSKKEIIAELEAGKGSQFDPAIVAIFLQLIAKKTVYKIATRIGTTANVENESTRLLQRIMNDVEKQNRLNNERDYLTNLWGRRGGEQRIIKAMKKQGGCLMVVDIDNFKKINDKYGHVVGDDVLKNVADSLRAHSDGSIIMRMGGDEFVLFMKDIHSKEEAKIVIDGIFYSLRKKMQKTKEKDVVSLSVGICFCTPNCNYQNKVNNADKALYRVKQNGKNGYMFYSKEDMG